ncbi:MAG TPA: peptidylprolyl isomerase [Trueperaceae bacterium]|nr:peptidylprolyl isomerase [Trueperaceae bacterium]
MARIIALVLVTLLLVFTGFWLARRPLAPDASANDGSAPAAAGAAAGSGAAGRPASAAAPKEAAAAAPTAAAGTGPSAAAPEAGVELPDGYAPVPYLSQQRELVFDQARQVLEPNTDYVAVLVTGKGPMTIRLDAQEAPRTVNNFVFLALHHFYDGVPFHRVLDGFMAQTGDPTGTGRGGPGYTFDDEVSPRLHFDKRGVVAMANAGPNTNGSQFFITFAATPWLDGDYNIFGQVIAGDGVLDKLQRIDPQNPEAVVGLDDTLGLLASKGVSLAGNRAATVGDALARVLGALPVAGQSFTVGAYRGVVGTAGGKAAVAFFPQPDTLERVVVAAKPAG